MNILRYFFIALICSVAYGVVQCEQGISVYAAVDKHTLTLDEELSLRVTVAGVGFFPPQDLPEIKGFSVRQTGQYTSADFSRGRPIPYTVYEYLLIPYNEGSFTIPSIYINYKGYYYTSKPINVSVEGRVRPITPDSAPMIAVSESLSRFSGAPLFVTSSISTTHALYNQQLVYTYTIFTRVPLKRLPRIFFPEYEAFHREPLDYRKIYTTQINGVVYKAIEMKCALFPFMTDEQTVPGVAVICDNNCFSDQSIPSFSKTANSIRVNVSPLPLENKPLDFSGLIGSFDISADVDKTTVTLNDSLILTVHVKGQGNISAIPDCTAPLVDKLREYETVPFLNFDKRENKLSGEKLFKMVLVPTDIGKETIPSMGFSYFDEDKKTYVTKWTTPLTITITEEKKEVKPEDKTKRAGTGKKKFSLVLTTLFAPYLILGGALFFSIILAIVFVRRRRRRQSYRTQK